MINKSVTFSFALFFILLGSCKGQDSELIIEKQQQSYRNQSPIAHHQTALEVLAASKNWIKNFNNGNGLACASGYKKNAIMRAAPFGDYKGLENISKFWTDFIKTGASNLVYSNVSIEVVNEQVALLSANWSMNVGQGVIYQEKWEKTKGKWVLAYDNFEVLEQFKNPKNNISDPVKSHKALEAVIKASIDWTKGFNSRNSMICGNGYTEQAFLNPSPFPQTTGKTNIQAFWKGLIDKGAHNLIYNNPTFKSITSHTVLVSSNWSMNIGEGKIFQEKWVLENGNWLLEYDDFMVLNQY